MLEKAPGLDVDAVFLDLEDAVAPDAKAGARDLVVAALHEGDWSGKAVTVRVNDATRPGAHRDVVEIVSRAGDRIDAIMLPKVEHIAHVHWIDVLLGQLEREHDLEPGRIGLELIIEGPRGLADVQRIAAASPRLDTLVYGPGDFTSAMRIPTLTVGDTSIGGHDPIDPVFSQLAVAARANDAQVIDGPYAGIHDFDGLRRAAEHTRAFGFDGKWVLHPAQIEVVNEVFTPDPAAVERAERILAAYAHHTSAAGGTRGAVLFEGEMIDEATHRMARTIAAAGHRAGLGRGRDDDGDGAGA
ncbi:citrate lyase subunit beta/citryl-CoA lyase [Pseudoclavibacter chungangensis]|nr:citrate lyase subunit beta/citryl-CoA lyase [Pseudoclavibacter chungangensis]